MWGWIIYITLILNFVVAAGFFFDEESIREREFNRGKYYWATLRDQIINALIIALVAIPLFLASVIVDFIVSIKRRIW